MGIIFNEQTREFHLYNDQISYIMKILRNGHMGQLYFGKRIPQKENYDYMLEKPMYRPLAAYVYENDFTFSLETLKQEYPVYGSTDFRMPAVQFKQENGSHISHFEYMSHKIYAGKPGLEGLPAVYVEDDKEADTLEVTLFDKVMQMEMTLLYTIYNEANVIARSVRFENKGTQTHQLDTAMSMCLDLPDCNYEWVQFSGAWSRERYVKTRKLQPGITSVGSVRGASSAMQNPFVILKRPSADEFQGEVMGFSLIYSGNFLAQAEVDAYNVTRFTMGIHPTAFSWCMKPGAKFQTPEAVIVYSKDGMNDMSHTIHKLFRTRLARGEWRDKERPVLINNWEATYFDFNEEKLLQIAKTAKEDGVELFVLDDGWFSTRCSDDSGLGDWWANTERLPEGIKGLSEKVEALGMKFGLWVELEMVNKKSELYKNHPDWILHTPERSQSHGRRQHVLDFSRKEVVDYIYEMIAEILRESKVSYIKWDMNRYITECYSVAYPAEQQGEIFHRYILGLYDLYERLTSEFPHILFESCASGGGRFDPGMLYYAPQAWCSDDTDAVERIKIQYGTSYAYPISSMGAHVSITPNHQLNRTTPLKTRGDVAMFGAFGYELDLGRLTEEERQMVRDQIKFVKQYRGLIHKGEFYRLQSPFENNISAWMVVSEDKKQAIVAYFKILNDANCEYRRLQLKGLDENLCYQVVSDGVDTGDYYGSELMNVGMVTTDTSAGQILDLGALDTMCTDFWSKIVVLNAK